MNKYSKMYPVALMSKTLRVSKSGYYKWLKTKDDYAALQVLLKRQILQEFNVSKHTYGSPRISIELNKKGVCLSKTTVARYMNSMRLVARKRPKFVVATDSDHDYKIAENLLDRQFNVEQINKVWVSDITYIQVGSGFNYLTTYIDLADRMVVGWALSKDLSAENTTISALTKALKNRNIGRRSGLMIHSDRGVQYASHNFRSVLRQYGCVQSMSRKGNCWDNAVAESFFKTIKIEWLNKYIFNNQEILKTFIFRYIDGWYNTRRINSALNYKTPYQVFVEKLKKRVA